MPAIININLLYAACEYTSVCAERKTNPEREMTRWTWLPCLLLIHGTVLLAVF